MSQRPVIVLGSTNLEKVVPVSDERFLAIRQEFGIHGETEKHRLEKLPWFDHERVAVGSHRLRVQHHRIGGGGINAAYGVRMLNGKPILITGLSHDLERLWLGENRIQVIDVGRDEHSIGIDLVSESRGHILFGYRGKEKSAADQLAFLLDSRIRGIIAAGAKINHIKALYQCLDRLDSVPLFIGPSVEVLADARDGGESRAVLAKAKAIQINAAELHEVFPHADSVKPETRLHELGIGLVFVTRASDGGIASDGNGKLHYEAYPPPGRIADTTGAGDGFLTCYGWEIINGKTHRIAVRRARIAASYIVTRYGGPSMPTAIEIDLEMRA